MTPTPTTFGALDRGWQTCPPGELWRLTWRRRLRRWGSAAAGATGTALVCFALAVSAWQTTEAVGRFCQEPSPLCDRPVKHCAVEPMAMCDRQ
jgi:hypothetical protein